MNKSNKTIFAFFGLMIALNPISLFANSLEQKCVMKPISDPLVAGRAWSVTFPNQRTITVVGHNHGVRQIRQLYGLADNCRLYGDKKDHGRFCTSDGKLISDEQFKETILSIKNQNRGQTEHYKRADIDKLYQSWGEYSDIKESEFVLPKQFEIRDQGLSVMDHADRDYNYLKKIILDQKGLPYFIGHEATESATKADISKYQYAIASAKKEYAIRNNQSDLNMNYKEFEQIIRSATMGNNWFVVHQGRNFPNVRFIGTEFEEISKYINYDTIQELSQATNAFIQKIESLPEVKQISELNLSAEKNIKKIPYNIRLLSLRILVADHESSILQNIRNRNDLQLLIESIQSVTPKELEKELTEFIIKLQNRVQFNQDRDYYSAKNMVAQNISGTHFVGMNHLANTLRYLTDFCRNELAGNIDATNELVSSRTLNPHHYYFSSGATAPKTSNNNGGTQ